MVIFRSNTILKKKVFAEHDAGPTLAYSLHNPKHPSWVRINKYLDDSNEKDDIILVFGEIDCRCHIIKQAIKEKIFITTSAICAAEKYFSGVLRASKKRKISVWAAIPSVSEAQLRVKNAEYPHIGSEVERNIVTCAFNGMLQKLCVENNIRFFSVFNSLINNDGTARLEYYKPNEIHLNDRTLPMIIKELKCLIPK